MINKPIIVDNFLHVLNQRKLTNFFQSANTQWSLSMFPSYGNKVAQCDFERADNQEWKDSPTLGHMLYMKDQKTDVSSFENFAIKLFQQEIEKQVNAKIEIIRCMAIIVIPNPNFTAQCMMPHTDWTIPHETCIYYANSTDGDTILFDQKYDVSLSTTDNDSKKKKMLTKISPVTGKAVLFDGLQYHASNPSKTDLRFVLNINYVRV